MNRSMSKEYYTNSGIRIILNGNPNQPFIYHGFKTPMQFSNHGEFYNYMNNIHKERELEKKIENKIRYLYKSPEDWTLQFQILIMVCNAVTLFILIYKNFIR